MKPKMESETTTIAEIGIWYRPLVKVSTLPSIKCSEDVYKIFLETWDKGKLEFVEQFKVMLVNRGNRVLGICHLTTGSSTYCVADPRLIFGLALIANACNLIVAHNHPSGNLKPSLSDENLTTKLNAGAKLLDLSLLDHLIISADGYYSFADEGAL